MPEPETHYPITNLYVLLYNQIASRVIVMIKFMGRKHKIFKARELSSRQINKIHKIVSKYNEISQKTLVLENYAIYRFGTILLIGEITKKEFAPYAIGFLRKISKIIHRTMIREGKLRDIIN